MIKNDDSKMNNIPKDAIKKCIVKINVQELLSIDKSSKDDLETTKINSDNTFNSFIYEII